jgi:hypothetical protein
MILRAISGLDAPCSAEMTQTWRVSQLDSSSESDAVWTGDIEALGLSYAPRAWLLNVILDLG